MRFAIAAGGIAGATRGYFYDAAWNLNRRTNNATTYTFPVNSLNQLTKDPANGGTISYDSNGNRSADNGTLNRYFYCDAENQLTSIEFQYAGYKRILPTMAAGACANAWIVPGMA